MYDMKQLRKMKVLEACAPETMKAFVEFDRASAAPGALSGKHKELLALAVTFTTQCPYCIELHAARARKLGATNQELPKWCWSPRPCAPAEPSPTELMPCRKSKARPVPARRLRRENPWA